MTVCKFWLQGNCRFGDSCRFEHPVNQNNNRFGVFGQASGGGGAGVGATTGANATKDSNPFSVSAANIVKDLTEDRPPWVFSAYGPGRNAPEQLFGGTQTEQSFEELRLHYYKAVAAGNPQAAINDIDGLYRRIQEQTETAVKNPADAARYVLQAEHTHPNRLDICANNSLPAGMMGVFAEGLRRGAGGMGGVGGGGGGFGAVSGGGGFGGFGVPSTASTATAAPSTGAFGAPSASPFGAKPAFGQPTGGATFGQPTQLGGGGVSAFGQPSKLGAGAGGAAFGQPSQLGGGAAPAFGQPPQPGTAAVGFGQPSALGGSTSAFGQPSALGQKPSPFGTASGATATGGGFSKFASSGTSGTSAFGQPSQLGSAGGGGFGTASAFGKPATLGATPSPFAAAAAANSGGTGTGAGASTASPFGRPAGSMGNTGVAPASNPFGSSTATTTNAGAANPFGNAAPANNPSPFGQPSQAAVANPFTAALNKPSLGATPAAAAATPSPFGQSSQPSAAAQGGVFGRVMAGMAPGSGGTATDSYAQRDASGRLVAFKGQRVVYVADKDGVEVATVQRPSDGKPVKVWFPNGPPAYNADTELPAEAYAGAAGDAAKAQYQHFLQTRRFEVGKMPETPPLRDWCQWDF